MKLYNKSRKYIFNSFFHYIFLIVFLFFSFHAKAQNQLITLTNQISLREAFVEIEKQTGLSVNYNNQLLNADKQISRAYKDTPLNEALNSILNSINCSYTIKGKHILITPKEVSQSKDRIIKGLVSDEMGEPIIGANVVEMGTTNGVITDIDGMFSLSVSSGAKIYISYIGYLTQEINVGNKSEFNIVLKEDSQTLDEVVVVGYGTMKKRDVLGSISTIKSDDIINTGATSLDAALQGMSSGVHVTTSGVPGAPTQIKVRGLNSISSGTDPLWVIDGIPVVSGTVDKSFDGETGQNVLSMINPSDIESMQVLKDAAATSIYGSRGSNGVILVTTKSGKKGTSTLDVNIRTGFSDWTKKDIGLANSSQFIGIMDLARQNSGLEGLYTPSMSLGQLDNIVSGMTREEALATNTNWIDEISRTGSFFEAMVSASNGSEKGDSYLSLTYRKDNSNLKFSDMQSIAANANLNYKLLDILSLGYRINISYTDNNRLKSSDGKNGAGGWAQANSNSLPWMKTHDEAGVNGFWNPLASINSLAGIDPVNSKSNLESLYLISGLTASLDLPVKGLTARGELGINHVNSKAVAWQSASIRADGAAADENKTQRTILNYNGYMNYDTSFNEIHGLNVVAGIEATRESTHATLLHGEKLVGAYPELGTPGVLSGSSALGDESYLLGYFGRANYKFKDRYYVGLSARRDGISKFTKENRWATFLAYSLGWVISEESFFNIDAINLLKLRGSYGQTGNTNIPTGITDDLWEIRSGTGSLMGTNSSNFMNIGNSNIKWETTSSIDLGFDFGLLQNRINGSISYYQQNVKDMLLSVSLPPSAGIFGGNSIWKNIGEMENYGLEANVNAVIIDTKDFNWNIGFNLSTNNNKILSLDPETDRSGVGIKQEYGEKGSGDSERRTITKKGLPLGTWYLPEYAGIDPDKGIPMIYEVQEHEDGSTSHTGRIIPMTETNMVNNRMILKGKTSLPKLVGGINTGMSYKMFDFNMVWSFATGNYIYNRLLQSITTPNTGVMTISEELLNNSWKKPGDNAKWPMTVMNVQYQYDDEGNHTPGVYHKYGSDNATPTSMYLEKGDFLRLRSVQIGCTLPDNITKPLKVRNLRVYISGNNLFTITNFSGYDPEVNIEPQSASSLAFFRNLPQSRVFTFGLSAKF